MLEPDPSTNSPRRRPPRLPRCSAPYRRTLHIGREVSVYFDPAQPPAFWPKQRHTHVQLFIFWKEADAIVFGKREGRWVGREVKGPHIWIVAAETSFAVHWRRDAALTVLYVEKTFAHENVGQTIVGATLLDLNVIGTHDVKLLQWLEEFVQIEGTSRSANPLYVESMGTLIAVHLFWIMERAFIGPVSAATSLSLAVFKRIERMIEKRMDEKITLWEMAREACMSANNFLRLFKRRIGISPRQYLIKQRIRRATELLEDDSLTISEIAFRVGFSSQAHLDESFKKVMKCTPTQYRTGYLKSEFTKTLGEISKAPETKSV